MLSVITTVSSGADDLITIDGADPGNEWPKAMEENSDAFSKRFDYSGYTLYEAIVSVIPDTGNNTVYYRFQALFNKKDVEKKIAVSIDFDGCSIESHHSDPDAEEIKRFNDNKHNIIYAASYIEEAKSTSMMLEAKVTDNGDDGFGENISCEFQIIDTDGNYSSVKSVDFTNPDFTTTSTTQVPTATKKTTKEKTTKEKTTKEKTTKEKTTKETTTKTTTEKTTRKKTTKETTQTTKRRTQSKTRAPYSKRTKPDRTKAKTPVRTTVRQTAAASSKAGKTRKTTKARTTARKNETREYVPYSYEYEETVTDETASSVTSDTDSVFQEKGLSKSVKYKAATGIAAAVLFGVIGISAVRSRNGQTEEKKDGENKEE